MKVDIGEYIFRIFLILIVGIGLGYTWRMNHGNKTILSLKEDIRYQKSLLSFQHIRIQSLENIVYKLQPKIIKGKVYHHDKRSKKVVP